MTLSQLALEDVTALYLEPSILMADPMGPLLDQDEEEALSPFSSLEGKAPASPPLSFSSYASSLSPYQTLSCSPLSSASVSPPPSPPSHPSFLGTKARADSLSLPWLGANDLLDADIRADDGEDDAFEGMDWMSEKIDLSEFDLDSLIGSCSSDESPSSPEDLLASLDSHIGLDPFDTSIPVPNSPDLSMSLPSVSPAPLGLPLPGATEAKKTESVSYEEVDMKSEPPSPIPSPPPPSSVYTLELGSEVDILDAEKTATALTAIIPDPSGSIPSGTPIVLSLPSSGHIVVVLTKKEEPTVVSLFNQSAETPPPSTSNDSDSDSGIESGAGSPSHSPSVPAIPSPPAGSSRTKPYNKPEPASPSKPSSKVKSVSGAPKVVEKKLKKMEQNKTAATRYRLKKRVEQELLGSELEDLEKRNTELKEKAESISKEIQYLKDLMEEVRKHRRGKTSAEKSS